MTRTSTVTTAAADALEVSDPASARTFLALSFERHVRDFVQKQRAAMGLLEHADRAGRARPANAGLGVPNNSIWNRSGARACAAEHDERTFDRDASVCG